MEKCDPANGVRGSGYPHTRSRVRHEGTETRRVGKGSLRLENWGLRVYGTALTLAWGENMERTAVMIFAIHACTAD